MNREEGAAPGPWEYHDGKIYAGDGDVIATLNHHPLYDTDKTGRLMAAAPELFEVLEELEGRLSANNSLEPLYVPYAVECAIQGAVEKVREVEA